MKLSVRISNGGLILVMGTIIALLLLRDIALHRESVFPSPSSDRVVAKEFTLVDDSGKTRARLAMTDKGSPSLQLFDQAGQQRAQLRLNGNDVPSLRLYGSNGILRQVVGFNLSNEEPVVVHFDTNGTGKAITSSSSPFTADQDPQIFHDEDTVPEWRRHSERSRLQDIRNSGWDNLSGLHSRDYQEAEQKFLLRLQELDSSEN